MPDRKVTISVETTADTKGVEETTKAVTDLGKTSDASGKQIKESSGHVEGLGRVGSHAAHVMHQLDGAMGEGGPLAHEMGMGMKLLTSIIEGSSGGIGGLATILAGFGVAAWVSYHNKVEETKKKLMEFKLQLQDNAREIAMSKVGEEAERHDKLRTAIDAEADAYNRMASARAAADNAEKGWQLASISLREKQAQLALKPGDELGAAKVSAQYSGERANVETDFAQREAKRNAEVALKKSESAAERLNDTDRQIEELNQALEKAKAEVLKLAQEKVDNHGAGAPMREDVVMGMGPMGVPVKISSRMVVDKEKQADRDKEIDNQLQGSKDSPGLTANVEKLSDGLAALLVEKAKEKVEKEAREIEAGAALKNLTTVNSLTPRVNATEAQIEQRDILEKQKKANLEMFKGRSESLVSRAQMDAESSRQVSDMYDPSKMSFGRNGDRARANEQDRGLAQTAAKFATLAKSAKELEETIEKMDPDALTRSFDSISKRIERLDAAVKNAEDRSKRQ